jgi:hypothetical protein
VARVPPQCFPAKHGSAAAKRSKEVIHEREV